MVRHLLRPFRVCPAGSEEAPDKVVWPALDFEVFFFDPRVEVVLDMQAGREYNLVPSAFPAAVRWAYRNKYTIAYEPAPYNGNKRFTRGVEEQKVNMVLNCDLLVAFVDLGGDNEWVEDLTELARRFGKPCRVVRY